MSAIPPSRSSAYGAIPPSLASIAYGRNPTMADLEQWASDRSVRPEIRRTATAWRVKVGPIGVSYPTLTEAILVACRAYDAVTFPM